MHYNPSTGKRIKDETIPGRINWLHTTHKRRHQLPKDWPAHPMPLRRTPPAPAPRKTIALVESEKTAIICAALMPQYLWLATGGKSQFNNRLTSLKVSDLLEKYVTPADRAAHIDLADWLIEYLMDKS